MSNTIDIGAAAPVARYDCERALKRLRAAKLAITLFGLTSRLRTTRPGGPALEVGDRHFLPLTAAEAKALGIEHKRRPSIPELVARGLTWAEIDAGLTERTPTEAPKPKRAKVPGSGRKPLPPGEALRRERERARVYAARQRASKRAERAA